MWRTGRSLAGGGGGAPARAGPEAWRGDSAARGTARAADSSGGGGGGAPRGPVAAVDPPPRLRVLHVSQPVDGGVRTVVASLIADQHHRGWEVLLACPGGGLADD